MARVVGVYALVIVCIFTALMFCIVMIHAPMLTYVTHYYDTLFAVRLGEVLSLWDTFTGRTLELLDSHEYLYDQVWSPDGRLVAITSQEERASTLIIVLDIHGKMVLLLNSDSGNLRDPNWLPDSEHILFVFDDGIDIIIYSSDINMTDVWHEVLHLSDFSVRNMTLSSNGRYMIIAVQSNLTNDLYIIEIDNPQLNILTQNVFDVSWSPDNEQIVFSKFDEAGSADLYILQVSDRSEIRLTDSPSRDFQPVWSPDGSQIAFVSDRDGDNEIYIMNVDGTNVHQVTFNDVSDTNPAWVP